MEFPVIVLLYAVEEFLKAEEVNTAPKALRESRSFIHASELSEVPQTCLNRGIIIKGSTTN
jgi:hypothetical protein